MPTARASGTSPHLLLALTAVLWATRWSVARAVVPHVTAVVMAVASLGGRLQIHRAVGIVLILSAVTLAMRGRR